MDIETFMLCLAAYLAIGCNIAWGAVKHYCEANKKALGLVEVFILNMVLMVLWPIVFIWALMTRR